MPFTPENLRTVRYKDPFDLVGDPSDANLKARRRLERSFHAEVGDSYQRWVGVKSGTITNDFFKHKVHKAYNWAYTRNYEDILGDGWFLGRYGGADEQLKDVLFEMRRKDIQSRWNTRKEKKGINPDKVEKAINQPNLTKDTAGSAHSITTEKINKPTQPTHNRADQRTHRRQAARKTRAAGASNLEIIPKRSKIMKGGTGNTLPLMQQPALGRTPIMKGGAGNNLPLMRQPALRTTIMKAGAGNKLPLMQETAFGSADLVIVPNRDYDTAMSDAFHNANDKRRAKFERAKQRKLKKIAAGKDAKNRKVQGPRNQTPELPREDRVVDWIKREYDRATGVHGPKNYKSNPDGRRIRFGRRPKPFGPREKPPNYEQIAQNVFENEDLIKRNNYIKHGFRSLSADVSQTAHKVGHGAKDFFKSSNFINSSKNFFNKNRWARGLVKTAAVTLAINLAIRMTGRVFSGPAIPEEYERGYDIISRGTDFGSPLKLSKAAHKAMRPYYSTVRSSLRTNVNTVINGNFALASNMNAIGHMRY